MANETSDLCTSQETCTKNELLIILNIPGAEICYATADASGRRRAIFQIPAVGRWMTFKLTHHLVGGGLVVGAGGYVMSPILSVRRAV